MVITNFLKQHFPMFSFCVIVLIYLKYRSQFTEGMNVLC